VGRFAEEALVFAIEQTESWGPFAEGQRGLVAIPKSARLGRMAENFDSFDFQLSPDRVTTIAPINICTSGFFDHHDPAIVEQLSAAIRNREDSH
jgi:hypothetical protein